MKKFSFILLIGLVSLIFPFLGNTMLREIQPLDGEWEIAFDPQNQGRGEKWHKQDIFSDLEKRRGIQVPSCWEEIEQDYEGVAFYARQFSIPNEWAGKIIRLQFDAVNYIAEVWLNDYAVGRHEGGYGPFEFRVDDLLKPGKENFLSLRVLGPIIAEDKVIDGIGKSDMPHWRGALAAGIWQSVRLLASGTVTVERVFIIPNLGNNSVNLQVTLNNTETKKCEKKFQITINDADSVVVGQKEVVHLLPGKNIIERKLIIPDVHCWSPEDPHLYTAKIQIGNSDLETIRFGMRELTIRNEQFLLNGKPIYIKAVFFEGLYPTKLALPDNQEMAIREIQLAKDAGFNMIRPWRKPPPPMWLDLCDEMGMLVVGSMPIECMLRWPSITPQMPERIKNEVRTAIFRDRNRACVVQWEIFNEIGRKELKRLKHPMSMLARELDPTRLILDESGGFAGGANIYLPYQLEPIQINDIHRYPGAPLSAKTFDAIINLGREKQGRNSKTAPGRLTFLSEIGYGSIPDLVENNILFEKEGNPLVPPYRYHKMLEKTTRAVLKESKFDTIYPDLQQFCLEQQKIHSDANKRMIEAFRSNPAGRGYCVHALTGGDWVLGAGLLDLWRNPKESYWGTKKANQPRYLSLRINPRNIYAGQNVNISVTGINDLNPVSGILKLDIFNDDDKRVYQSKKEVEFSSGISALLNEQVELSSLSGSFEAHIKLLLKDDTELAKNFVQFNIFKLKIPQRKIAILDLTKVLRPFLNSMNIPYIEFDVNTPTTMPVFVSSARAKKSHHKASFKKLKTFVEKGGTAVYLETLLRPKNSYWRADFPSKEVLPIKATKQHGLGLWVGVSHIVTDHPVFTGLPVNCMMGQIYENVWSPHCLRDTGGEIIVGSVSYGFYGRQAEKQHHLGPEPAWYGMDMGVLKYGEGRYVLSTLRLLENLGKDPVADKILYNLINWVAP